MRGATSLLARLVLSLVLLVAVWPAQASGMACALPRVVASKAACPMPCCQRKAMACDMAAKVAVCCQPKSNLRASAHDLTKATAACPCEFRSAPSAPVALEKAVFQGTIVALLPPSLSETIVWLPVAEPGIYGADSGPPLGIERYCASPRAPPVARV